MGTGAAGRYPCAMSSGMELVAVSVGNTRTRIGVFRGRELASSGAVVNTDLPGVVRAIVGAGLKNSTAPLVMASVNDPIAEQIMREAAPAVRGRGGEIYRFGSDLSIQVPHSLGDASGVGQDRLLNALGAYSRAQQACIIVDAGTAITVDFVDGQGIFHGGAIGPGLNLMLMALHEHTAALPALRFEQPAEGSPFGKDTREAMLLGVQGAARGMVRHLIEKYSEFYEAYPQIIATGGDARTLFESDDIVEHIVPDLTLIGMQAACQIELGEADED
jgi:type III pantothenate kinase